MQPPRPDTVDFQPIAAAEEDIVVNLKKMIQGAWGRLRKPGGDEAKGRERSGAEPRTAGTDRDFDETGRSKNQGHGHPREERRGQPEGEQRRGSHRRGIQGGHAGQGETDALD